MEIKQFMGPFRFLSNFYPSEITHNGIAYPTVEHFYQAMKCVDKNEAFAIANAATPAQAKRMGRKVKIRPDWESIKEQIMGFALWEKFKNPKLREKLIETGNATLIEGNYWHDNYWGECQCEECMNKVKQNRLGCLLMAVRSMAMQEEGA